jgi:hypothetical protein
MGFGFISTGLRHDDKTFNDDKSRVETVVARDEAIGHTTNFIPVWATVSCFAGTAVVTGFGSAALFGVLFDFIFQ